jgi:hypothetical protein
MSVVVPGMLVVVVGVCHQEYLLSWNVSSAPAYGQRPQVIASTVQIAAPGHLTRGTAMSYTNCT